MELRFVSVRDFITGMLSLVMVKFSRLELVIGKTMGQVGLEESSH